MAPGELFILKKY